MFLTVCCGYNTIVRGVIVMRAKEARRHKVGEEEHLKIRDDRGYRDGNISA